MEEEAAVALNPASIPAILAAHVAAHGGEIILRKKDRGIWKAVTWAEFGSSVHEISSGLTKMGFRPGDVACVLAETRPEWAYIDLGILAAAGISGGRVLDNSERQHAAIQCRSVLARLRGEYEDAAPHQAGAID